MTTTAPRYTVLAPNEGLRLESGPGRDLIFKVTGEDTGGAHETVNFEATNRAPRTLAPIATTP